MSGAVICDSMRTPIGKYGGSLSRLAVEELAGQVIRALIDATSLPSRAIGDVILGHCGANGESPCVGRQAALWAGLPTEVTGFQLDRRCGSGLQAICLGAALVEAGAADVVVAGGAESMSQAEHYAVGMRFGKRGETVLHDRLERSRVMQGSSRYRLDGGMLETAENIRRRYGISREDQDAFALASHRKAVAAWDAGTLGRSVIPLVRDGAVIDRDERPRRDTTAAKLADLPAIRGDVDPDATVTAANASGESDGAAAAIVCSRAAAARHGLRPRATIRAWAVAGVEPAYMGLGVVPASARALQSAGLSLHDMDVIEVNEAFAVQVLACLREWGLDEESERLNPNGGAVALGHPLGATGARIVADMLDELERREARYGLAALCIGGGQGIAAIVEREA